MSPWLLVQALFAAAAWYIAARAVLRAAVFAGESGPTLVATVRELRRVGRASDVASLGAALAPSPAGRLLEGEAEHPSAIEIIAEADRALAAGTPSDRALRGLATVGTTLGLLAAVAALRVGLSYSSGPALERAAAQALDSAVLGFVTALPCWTAVGLCRRRARSTAVSLEQVLLALRSLPSAPDGVDVAQSEQ